MLHYASSAAWHTLVTLEIAYHSLVKEAEPMQSSVLHGVFYVYLPLHGAPQIGLFITCRLSLGCEILGEDWALFTLYSLLLRPCLVSGMELILGDFDLHITALNWSCVSWL